MSNVVQPAGMAYDQPTLTDEATSNGHKNNRSETKAKKEPWEPPIREDYREGSKALMILFGWAGCRDRYLKKYSEIYSDAGISTVRFTAPISKIRHFSDYRPLAQRVFDTVFGLDGKGWQHEVYFHVFSMNGCSTFCAFWDALRGTVYEQKFKERVRGIIYDSCPANVSPHQSARAISFAGFPPPKHHPAVRESVKAFLLTYFSLQRMMIWLRSMWDEGAYEKNFAFHRMLAIDDLPQRQLYIYSPGDDICTHTSIENFSENQRKAGKQVEEVCLPASEHCQHMRRHPEEYKKRCLDFIPIDHHDNEQLQQQAVDENENENSGCIEPCDGA